MSEKIQKIIAVSFYFLIPCVLLIFHPKTSELFEFNKIIVTYLFTTLILFLWSTRIIIEKRLIFRRTIFDIPLLIFILSQLLSTLTSIDFRTSFLGYYSRFHGGFASLLSYSLLYWAFVSNMKRSQALKFSKMILYSSVVVSIWAILEHFGHSISCLMVPEFRTFDVSCWIQDVQSRVYATMGQPNWLAAWLVSIIPLTWAFFISNQSLSQKYFKSASLKYINKILWLFLSLIFFITLLFTKSRSGILGFCGAVLIFWGVYLFKSLKNKKIISYLSVLLIINLSLFIAAAFIGTPWTPKINDLFSTSRSPSNSQPNNTIAPALEIGGSSSVEIRKIVWEGAIDIWKHYPILGTGVETFAFSYYGFRPVEHNLVTEWDFLYNKAHNEYLNFAATTGTIGITSYLFLVSAVLFFFIKSFIFSFKKISDSPSGTTGKFHKISGDIRNFDNESRQILILAILSGYASILVTNFFGFSVVPIGICFFLFPAIAVSLIQESKEVKEHNLNTQKLSSLQKSGIIISFCFALLFFYFIGRYWYADLTYAKGKYLKDSGDLINAQRTLEKAVKLSPKEAIFWSELSDVTSTLASLALEQDQKELAENLSVLSIKESDKAVSLSPANVNLKRERATVFIKLSGINPNYMINALEVLSQAIKQAPTEAKLQYNLGIGLLRIGNTKEAIEALLKTIEMKPNYREARYALGLIYTDEGEIEKAKEQYNYILKNISSDDPTVQRELDELQ